MGSAGLEWNVAECDEGELETLRRWSALYREVREVLHTGTAVHADVRDPALRVVGAVSLERDAGLWTIAAVASLEDSVPERVRLHGLDPDPDPDRRYRVRDEIGPAQHGSGTPALPSAGGFTATGAVLSRVGIQIPALRPMQVLVLHAVATD